MAARLETTGLAQRLGGQTGTLPTCTPLRATGPSCTAPRAPAGRGCNWGAEGASRAPTLTVTRWGPASQGQGKHPPTRQEAAGARLTDPASSKALGEQQGPPGSLTLVLCQLSPAAGLSQATGSGLYTRPEPPRITSQLHPRAKAQWGSLSSHGEDPVPTGGRGRSSATAPLPAGGASEPICWGVRCLSEGPGDSGHHGAAMSRRGAPVPGCTKSQSGLGPPQGLVFIIYVSP